tara:strand:- start:1344 stop:3707 length:2364 start_codon:yes stop_codon:yes gene_type:complete
MSLTLPTNYANASKSGNIQENWIVRLYYDNEGANDYIGIALSDTTVESVFYHGVITNEPKIRTSINVFESKASTSQISLSIVNFNYKGLSFSEELLYGTRSYINRSVKIYSQLNGASAEADCLQIFEGRFVDISHDNEKISLSVVEQRPWDFIEIPNQRTVLANNQLGIPTYFPVAYGDFVANVSHQGAESICHANVANADTNLYPVPVHTYDADEFICLTAASHNGVSNTSSSAVPHFYEPNIDSFIPLLNSSGNTYMDNTTSYQGGNAINAPLTLFRAFRCRPTEFGSANQFTSGDNNGYGSFDTPVGSSATSLNTSSDGRHPPEIPNSEFGLPQPLQDNTTYSETGVGFWNMPSIDGRITYCKVLIAGYSSITALGTNITKLIHIRGNDMHGNLNGLTVARISSGATAAGTIYYIPFGSDGAAQTSQSIGTFTSPDLFAADSTNFKQQNFKLTCSYTWQVGDSNNKLGASGNCIVTDIQYELRTKLQFDSENMSANIERLNKVKMLYTGANGLSKSYTGGSGTASKGIEAHRDMLFRYAGFDASDSNIYNWSSGLNIASARSGWNIAYWCLEPKPLKNILQQLQYEFAFWFKWRADGSASYWYVKDSYASGDVTQTFTLRDMSGISIRNTSWKDLVTFYDVEFKRHPAKNSRYINSLSSQDSTNNTRSAFNIQTKENKKSVKLDMNINKAGDSDVGASTPNNGFSNYYLNLSGKVRKIISFKAVNPAKAYNLETGDIINFSSTSGDMPVKPFGHDWNESGSQYYMIIDLQRSRGNINIKCLEVG